MKIGLNSPQDLLALVVRRKVWIIGPFLALTCAFGLLTYILPRTYVSQTLIVVHPRDVPQDFVKDLIVGSPQERLNSIQQTILSRTNLITILREFEDKLPEFKRLNLDDQVLKLRGQISVVFDLDQKTGTSARPNNGLPLTYFWISYQNQNPDLAQKIASKLTSLFIEEDNRARETQVFGTTEFLSAEVDKIGAQLSESEAKLKDLKTSRQFELPDQRDINLRTLDRLGLDKKTNVEALDREDTIRLNLETQISQTPPTLPKPTPLIQKAAANPAFNLALEEYRKAQAEYDELSTRYTAKHPDVQVAKVRLERAKQQVPPELLAADTAGPQKGNEAEPPKEGELGEPNPVYQKLIAQLQEAKTELDIRQREKAWIDSEIAKYNNRLESTPKAEQDIGDAVRQNDELKKQYEDLKSKLAQARLSESLESKQKGSQFVIVDPANFPLSPAKPNKMLVLLAGALISLLISIGIAVVVDVAGQKIWTPTQVETLWGLPVLVDIPEIVTDVDVAALRRARYTYTAYSIAGASFWSVCLYGMYLKQAFLLRLLDPVLQKVVYK
jgi:polysaccharide chain length determinant protein (PEP-CTERM system associated)